MLNWVLDATNKERAAKHEEHVRKDGPEERDLHHSQQTFLQGKDADCAGEWIESGHDAGVSRRHEGTY